MSDLTSNNMADTETFNTNSLVQDADPGLIETEAPSVIEGGKNKEKKVKVKPRPRVNEPSGRGAETTCFEEPLRSHIHHHHLNCGHDIVTGKPEACGSNCEPTSTEGRKPSGGRFECPAEDCARRAAKRERVFVNWGPKAKHGRFCVLSHVYGRDEEADEERRGEKIEIAALKMNKVEWQARRRAYSSGTRSRGFFGPEKRSQSPTSDPESRETFRYRSPPPNRHRGLRPIAPASLLTLPLNHGTAPGFTGFATYHSSEGPETGATLGSNDSMQSEGLGLNQDNQGNGQEVEQEVQIAPLESQDAETLFVEP